MTRFQEIKKKLVNEFMEKYNSPHCGVLVDFDTEAARIYAEECCRETLKQADKRVKIAYNGSIASMHVLKKSILDKNNITIL